MKNKYIIEYSRTAIDKERTATFCGDHASTYSAGCKLAFSL